MRERIMHDSTRVDTYHPACHFDGLSAMCDHDARIAPLGNMRVDTNSDFSKHMGRRGYRDRSGLTRGPAAPHRIEQRLPSQWW